MMLQLTLIAVVIVCSSSGKNITSNIEPANLENQYYYIRCQSSGKYLEVVGGSFDHNANIHQWSFHGGDTQQFYLEYPQAAIGADNPNSWFKGKAGGIRSKYCSIKNKRSGKYLEPAGRTFEDKSRNGANVVQRVWYEHSLQQFELVRISSQEYYLKNIVTDKYLEVANDAQYDGGNIQQWSLHGGRNQVFQLSPVR